jgi:hypothetical protein
MAKACKYGKLKNPVGRRRCKKPPRGKGARASYMYTPPMAGARRRRKRRSR